MNYTTHDTEWAKSAKGNLWRRMDGVLLVVGNRKSDGQFWVRTGEDFLKGTFPTEAEAKSAAEHEVAGCDHETGWDDDLVEAL